MFISYVTVYFFYFQYQWPGNFFFTNASIQNILRREQWKEAVWNVITGLHHNCIGSNNCCTLGVTNSKLHQSFPVSQLSFYSFSSFFSLLWSITTIKVHDWKVCWCLNKVNLAVVSQNPVLNNPQCSWTFFLNICFCEQCKEGQKLTVERLLFY